MNTSNSPNASRNDDVLAKKLDPMANTDVGAAPKDSDVTLDRREPSANLGTNTPFGAQQGPDSMRLIRLDPPDRTVADLTKLASKAKPELVVNPGNLPATVKALRDMLADSGQLFDRGAPVQIIKFTDGNFASAEKLTKSSVVWLAHQHCVPVKLDGDGARVPVTLPGRVAQMYLEMIGEWRLPPLVGVTTSPLLSADGCVRVAEGYDNRAGLWCSGIPTLEVPSHPSRLDAEAALLRVRQAFRTFPFADALLHRDADLDVDVVDIARPPGRDESAFLVGLLTAVCRACLWLAPALGITAPTGSGSGSGKGLLVRAICAIAFGRRPSAFGPGVGPNELEKQLAAQLIEAHPCVFLDNFNEKALKSEMFASILTERPAMVRLLGRTRMVQLNSAAFIAVTGNGLSVGEDLARRINLFALDPRCEDPEQRPFRAGFLEEIERRRAELLTAALTIWRFGRRNAETLPRGKPLGSFEMWAEWCRDPLLALGCYDPVERIGELKADDPDRQRIAELFKLWWAHHGTNPVTANQLADPVKAAIPHNRSRQDLASFLTRLNGARAAGFALIRQVPVGKWSASSYALTKTAARGQDGG